MKPNLKILPPPQLALWPELNAIPKQFALYGGTAIALQLGHRESVDFDFFSSQPLDKESLLENLDFLQGVHIVQPEINTLNCFVSMPDGQVKIQFLASIQNRLARVDEFEICDDNNLQVASLRDLLGTKLHTIQGRAELKDYIDIDAIIQHGISLEEGLACAKAIYGTQYDIATTLRALCSYREGDLAELSDDIKQRLTNATTKLNNIPTIEQKYDSIT